MNNEEKYKKALERILEGSNKQLISMTEDLLNESPITIHPATQIPVDTLVEVWNEDVLITRYFKEFLIKSEIYPYKTFLNGATSKTKDYGESYRHCKIAENPWQVYDGKGQPVPDWLRVEVKLFEDGYEDIGRNDTAKDLDWGNETIYAYRIMGQDIPND